MIEKNVWFISPIGRGMDAVNVATDEPSHIHIARPSRLPRRDNADSSVEPVSDAVRDLAAEDLTVQAA